jgi:hypothetical protein
MTTQTTRAAELPEAPQPVFDAQGFHEWVLRNLPDDTIIGNSAWWANHLTQWAQRFVKAVPAQVEALSAAQAGVPAGKVIAWRLIHQSSLGHGDVKGSWIDGAPTEWQIADFSQNAPMARIEYAHAAPQLSPSPAITSETGNSASAQGVAITAESAQPSPPPAPAQPVQDLQAINDAVTIDLLNERVAYLEAELAKATAPAQPGQEGEREALARKHADYVETVGLMLAAVGYTEEYALQWPKEKASITFKRWFDEQIAAARAAPQPATADAVPSVEATAKTMAWIEMSAAAKAQMRLRAEAILSGLAAQREVKP